ncbi:hypothetical protein BMS3Abin07_00031 [bacterium BMS3Abin07]|nr:hypothetical protein BMS3Abin07_00031 [bacterium BMS3Abin07]
MLGLSRSSLYYKAVAVSARDVELKRLIDEIHLKYPFYGSRRIRDELLGLGYGGPEMDNVFIERLWRSVKYEDVYLKAYDSVPKAFGTGAQDVF